MTGKLLDYYPKFEANQVLTNDHLNDLRQYLDEQLRLSRSMLSGVGIACGLTFESTDTTVTIREGFGTTTAGYLMLFCGEEKDENGKGYSLYTRYRNYKDPSPDLYWSGNTAQEPEQITLKLLMTQEEFESEVNEGNILPDEGTYPIADNVYDVAAPITAALLDDMVLVLYLEIEDKALKNCAGNDCDNKGAKSYLKIRPLLIRKGAAAIMLDGEHEDHAITMVDMNAHVVRLLEPEVLTVPRFIKGLRDNGNALTDISTYNTIRDAYNTAILGYPATLYNNIVSAVNNYGPFLGLMDSNLWILENLNPFTYVDDTAQIAHDFLKDLTKAYNEFVSLCWELRRDCCIDDYEFERHLMLGAIQRTPTMDMVNPLNNDLYRNYFLSTAITPEQERRFRKAAWMYDRMLVMIKGFVQFKYEGDPLPGDDDTFLIPSREHDYPLGAGVIPQHYNPTSMAPYTLPQVWNPDLTLKDRWNEVFSFNPGFYATRPEVLQPLNYIIDPYPFFKAAIVLGRPWQSVIDGFNRLTAKYSIPVKAIALQLNGPIDLTDEDIACQFGYFQEDYFKMRSEMAVLLSNLGSLGDLGLELSVLASGFFLPADFITYYDGVYLDIQLALSPSTILEFCTQPPMKGGIEVPGFESWADWFGYLYQELQDGLLYIRMMLQHNLDLAFRNPPGKCSTPDFLKNVSVMERLIDTLDDVLDSGLFAGMVALVTSFRYRLNELIVGNPKLFSNFVRRHPGLEHLGGVPRGGTFIVVYENNDTTEAMNIVADFALPYLCCDDCSPPAKVIDHPTPLTLSPFPRPDMAVVNFGDSIDIFVKERDIDPPFGSILTNPAFIITSAFIENDPVAGAGTSVIITGTDFDRLTFTASPTVTSKPYFVRISYVLQNTTTGRAGDSTVLVMVKPPFLSMPKAVDDTAVTDTCTDIVIDVLKNDCLPATAYIIGFPLADGTVATDLITPLGAMVTVIPGGSAGDAPKLAYYPGPSGTDVFSYILVSEDGSSSTAFVTVQVLDNCCCCDDYFRTVKAGTTMAFDFFSEILAKHPANMVGLPAPVSGADQDTYYDSFVPMGNAGDFGSIKTLSEGYDPINPVASGDFTASINSDGLFEITPMAGYSGNLYIPYRITLFGGEKKCTGVIAITVSCDCSGGGGPCLEATMAPGFDTTYLFIDVLKPSDPAGAEVRFNLGGIPSETYPPLMGPFTILEIADDSKGNKNATFRYSVRPTSIDHYEWPFFVVIADPDGTVDSIVRECTARLDIPGIITPPTACFEERIIAADTASPVGGFLTSADVSAGMELRFKGPAPDFSPMMSISAPPPGIDSVILNTDMAVGGVNTGFLIEPSLGFTGTTEMPYYTVQVGAAGLTIVKDCTLRINVSPAGSFRLGGTTTKSPFFDPGISAVGESSDWLSKLDGMMTDAVTTESMMAGRMDKELAAGFITPLKLVIDEIAASGLATRRGAFFEEILFGLVAGTFKLANMQPKLLSTSPLVTLFKNELVMITDMITAKTIDPGSSYVVSNVKLLTPESTHTSLIKLLAAFTKSV